MAISNSASREIIWGLGGPEEDHQLHHCCWTGRVSEREEEEETVNNLYSDFIILQDVFRTWTFFTFLRGI